MPECSPEERQVLDALAKCEVYGRAKHGRCVNVFFFNIERAATFQYELDAWRASLSRGGAGSET